MMIKKNPITSFLQKAQNHSLNIPHVLVITNETNSKPEEPSDDSLKEHPPLYMADRPQ